MPGRNGTGPNGEGPLTGRGMGPCGRGAGSMGGYGRGAGYGGRGAGYGRGYGCRCWQGMPAAPPAPATKEDEASFLKAELNELEAEKKEIETRLKELEK